MNEVMSFFIPVHTFARISRPILPVGYTQRESVLAEDVMCRFMCYPLEFCRFAMHNISDSYTEPHKVVRKAPVPAIATLSPLNP